MKAAIRFWRFSDGGFFFAESLQYLRFVAKNHSHFYPEKAVYLLEF